MFFKIKLIHFAVAAFLVSLVGLAIVIYKPSFGVAMTFYAFQIVFGIIVVARAVTEMKVLRARKKI